MDPDDRLSGRATPEGTRRFAERFPSTTGHFRRPDDLWLSSIGLGTRGGEGGRGDDFLYRSSIPHALDRGVNVFDTALRYRSQLSERTLGASLRRRIAEGQAARDELYVITKGGYLTIDPELVQSAAEARRYLLDTYVESGLVDPDEVVDGVHSLEPDFLRDQIERSRRNLQLATIDLYCLEEPELHLLGKGPDAFLHTLARALEALEKAVSEGAIAAYGLSTWNGLLVPFSERGHLSIAEIFELALDVGGADHHLRGIQLPYSVGMGEALGLSTQFGPHGSSQATLEVLRDTGTAVFASVPLLRGRAVRGLPRFLRDAFPDLRTDAQRSLQVVRSSTGITTALVGMRQTEHVDENLELAEHAPAAEPLIRRLFREGAREIAD